jgi:hypothetical protein
MSDHTSHVVLRTFEPKCQIAIYAKAHARAAAAAMREAILAVAPDLNVESMSEWTAFQPEPDAAMLKLIINGHSFAIVDRRRPADASMFDVGPIDNIYVSNPSSVFAGHESYVSVFATRDPKGLPTILDVCRIVTVITLGLMPLVAGLGVQWLDARNILTSSQFANACITITKPNPSGDGHHCVGAAHDHSS